MPDCYFEKSGKKNTDKQEKQDFPLLLVLTITKVLVTEGLQLNYT